MTLLMFQSVPLCHNITDSVDCGIFSSKEIATKLVSWMAQNVKNLKRYAGWKSVVQEEVLSSSEQLMFEQLQNCTLVKEPSYIGLMLHWTAVCGTIILYVLDQHVTHRCSTHSTWVNGCCHQSRVDPVFVCDSVILFYTENAQRKLLRKTEDDA